MTGVQTCALPISCEVILQGTVVVLEYSINSLMDEAYYQEYDCTFWDCMGKGKSPFFFISKQAKDYWHGKFYFALITLIVLLEIGRASCRE